MNIATALKQEIARVARREVRAEVQALKKSSSQYRADIAALKRRMAEMEKILGKLAKGSPAKASPTNSVESGSVSRYSAKGLAAQRKRLGLSAAQMGVLLGVSGASVYLWEKGETRPRAAQMPAIAAMRGLSKVQAAKKLEAAA